MKTLKQYIEENNQIGKYLRFMPTIRELKKLISDAKRTQQDDFVHIRGYYSDIDGLIFWDAFKAEHFDVARHLRISYKEEWIMHCWASYGDNKITVTFEYDEQEKEISRLLKTLYRNDRKIILT